MKYHFGITLVQDKYCGTLQDPGGSDDNRPFTSPNGRLSQWIMYSLSDQKGIIVSECCKSFANFLYLSGCSLFPVQTNSITHCSLNINNNSNVFHPRIYSKCSNLYFAFETMIHFKNYDQTTLPALDRFTLPISTSGICITGIGTDKDYDLCIVGILPG